MALLSDIVGVPTLSTVQTLQATNDSLSDKFISLQTSISTMAASNLTQTISSEGDIGTLTWGGTAPTGITKKYRWVKTGRLVTGYFIIRASGAGLAVTSVAFPLPDDFPLPEIFSTITVSSLAVPGSGGIMNGVNANITGGQAALYRLADVGGVKKFEVRITTTLTLLAAVSASAQIQYVTAS